jgi:ubiquinone/menaquinone biosynthesis C-methylase UbiE
VAQPTADPYQNLGADAHRALAHRGTMRGVDHERIYADQAAEYDALVSAEDCDGHLLPAIEAIAPLPGTSVLEVGAGTGRITRLLVGRGASVMGVDRSPAMLAVARRHLEALGPSTRWELRCEDARDLSVSTGWADVAIAGWVFGHFRTWFEPDWRAEVGRALAGMERALKPGGVLVLVETLGTGREDPSPPSAGLAEYFAWLEEERGLARVAIRTDYLFSDVETAARVTGFFFGDAFGERVRREGWRRVPECTGIWWRRV